MDTTVFLFLFQIVFYPVMWTLLFSCFEFEFRLDFQLKESDSVLFVEVYFD